MTASAPILASPSDFLSAPFGKSYFRLPYRDRGSFCY
jgi:hypothetical protein